MKGYYNTTDKAMEAHHVQFELKSTTFGEEASNDRQPIIGKDAKINRTLPYMFDALHFNLSGAVAIDKSQGVVVIESSNNNPDRPMTKNRRVVEVILEELDLTKLNVINDTAANLDPIVGYASEPLVTLTEACAPLTTIIHNLSFYVELALNETSKPPPNGLTIDESAAIRLYTIEWVEERSSLYSVLNRTLKTDTRKNLQPYFKYLKLFLTALTKLPCVPPSTIWRGVTKDLSAQFPAGTKVIWWGFSSCTTSLPVLESNLYLGDAGKRTLFSVEAFNSRDVRAHSHFVCEDEVLLLPGTQMVVQSQFSPGSDLHIIHLKQVIPEEVLLEPPFEGISKFFNHLF